MQSTNLKEIFFSLKTKIKNFNKSYGRIFWVLIFIILFFILIYIYENIFSSQDLQITFFDIGQGDAALIKTPGRENILIDAGPNNLILKKLEDSLSIFDRNIDLAILSHPDADHVAGYISIFQNYKVKNILENGDETKESEIYQEIKKSIQKEKDEYDTKEYFANCGDEISFPGKRDEKLKIYIIHPMKNNLVINDTNDNSIVALVTFDQYGFLFTGDASQDVEKKIFFEIENCFNKNDSESIKKYFKDLTVLKVSHHGSKSGSSEDFIRKISPEYSIISAGKNNRYGHPNDEVLKILEKYSKNILNTINDGDITFVTDGKNLIIKKSR
ncbi:MAG: MBL fold metallo-hydrolase [Candidatus Paceibacterota bacterium]